jgi:hypothetical protein
VYESIPSLQCIGDLILDLIVTVAHVDLSLSICYGAKIIATELRLVEKRLYRVSVYLMPRHLEEVWDILSAKYVWHAQINKFTETP